MSDYRQQLTGPQLQALLDILTHHETYREIESFKGPTAIARYGYPFSTGTEGGGPVSATPLLQLPFIRLVLDMPGMRAMPPDFYNVKYRAVMQRLGEADLSESYDKGSMGTRKTLATAASAFWEALARGLLGGVPVPGGDGATPRRQFDPDRPSAAELEASWDFCVRDVVYGDLLERLFHYARQSQDFDRFSEQVGDSIEYIVIHMATFMHYILAVSPEGPYLLKLIESFNKL
ncbi:uncharacterized protein PG986_010219 [Apiospora aurea]|uniref:PX-associated domain-containing protein n=1 Tax=Apiospora aurea TaxID=335848 RepID=A0ABR1QA92_9PEZI